MKLKNLIMASGLAALAVCEEPKVATIKYGVDLFGAAQIKLIFECHKIGNEIHVYENKRSGMNFVSSYNTETKELQIANKFLTNGVIYVHPEVSRTIAAITETCVDKLNSRK